MTISYVRLKNCEINDSEKEEYIIFQEKETKYILKIFNQVALVEVLLHVFAFLSPRSIKGKPSPLGVRNITHIYFFKII